MGVARAEKSTRNGICTVGAAVGLVVAAGDDVGGNAAAIGGEVAAAVACGVAEAVGCTVAAAAVGDTVAAVAEVGMGVGGMGLGVAGIGAGVATSIYIVACDRGRDRWMYRRPRRNVGKGGGGEGGRRERYFSSLGMFWCGTCHREEEKEQKNAK